MLKFNYRGLSWPNLHNPRCNMLTCSFHFSKQQYYVFFNQLLLNLTRLILQMDKITGQVFTMVNADDGKMVKEDEFKKLLTEILANLMLQLDGNPISTSSDSVVHEPLGSSSTLLQPSSTKNAHLSH